MAKKTAAINFLVEPILKKMWKQAADKDERSMTGWITHVCTEAARKALNMGNPGKS